MSIYILIKNLGTESKGPTLLTKQLINGYYLEQFKSIYQPAEHNREWKNIQELYVMFAHPFFCR